MLHQRRSTETVGGVEGGASPAAERGVELASSLPLGSVVAGRYEVLAVLGNGGFAVVYRALDRELNREVALKILRADRLTPETLRRFRREAALARDVVSARLVRIFDIGRSGEELFLTMEIAAGGSLDRRMAAGRLPIDEAVRIAAQALAGLEALHALRIVHRDVKPGNFLLTAEDDVKLADFGLARQLDADESRLTRDHDVLGTFQYLSPEQALGEEIDARSDLYSLGVVLFEMLTGHLPYEGRSALGAFLGHLREKPREVRAWRPEIPPWLAAIVARLLARSPSARYPSAAAALAALSAGGRPTPHLGWVRRVLAVLLALIGLGIGFAPRFVANAWHRWNAPRLSHLVDRAGFSHLVDRVGGGVAALSNDGRVLWTVPTSRLSSFKVARLQPGQAPVVVGFREPTGTPEATHMLAVLDPMDGHTLRQVRLPSDEDVFFPGFSHAFSPDVAAVDLDGDGGDEILVTYFHSTLWPCYLVLYEPRIERVRVAFVASGQHRLAPAVDLDGDGRAELLMAGINNRMGWYTGVAAIRLVPPVNDLTSAERAVACTPDTAYSVSSPRSLLWYVLGSNERFLDDGQACRVLPGRRLLDCAYAGETHLLLGFDGFPPGPGRRSGDSRRVERERCYRDLREVVRLLEGSTPASALPLVTRAVTEAALVEDGRLSDWAGRLRARTLIAAGHLDEGEESFERLVRSSEAPSDVCFDAGKALHLAGSLEPAVKWYRRGFGPGGAGHSGRGKWEYLEGEVLALAELGRFAEGRAEIQYFLGLYPDDSNFEAAYQAYLRWREGEKPAVEKLDIVAGSPDFLRYFRLELLSAHGADPRRLLADIVEDLSRSSEARPQLLSLESVVLSKLGRATDAKRAALESYELALVERSRNTAVRAQFKLIEQRAARWRQPAGA